MCISGFSDSDSARPCLRRGSGFGRPVEEDRALLAELLAHGTQDRFVYRHLWRVGDLVMWDNRAVLHRGRPWDQTKHARIMHRTTVAGEAAENP